MAKEKNIPTQAKREYTQLLHIHERLLVQFTRARDELAAGETQGLVKAIRGRTGSAPELALVRKSVEETIRALKLSESQVRTALADDPDPAFEIEGVPNMPAYLRRFLGERADLPGFSYEIQHDPVRGWMVCWKEYTKRGSVRGYGQFSERPYAWLDD